MYVLPDGEGHALFLAQCEPILQINNDFVARQAVLQRAGSTLVVHYWLVRSP